MTVLYAAHLLVEQLTLDRDLTHLRDRLAPEVAEMVYYGFWYAAEDGRPVGVHSRGPETRHRRSAAQALQGQHQRRQPHEPQQPVRRGHRQHGGGRQLQPDRCRRVSAHPVASRPRAGPRHAAQRTSRCACCWCGKIEGAAENCFRPPKRIAPPWSPQPRARESHSHESVGRWQRRARTCAGLEDRSKQPRGSRVRRAGQRRHGARCRERRYLGHRLSPA